MTEEAKAVGEPVKPVDEKKPCSCGGHDKEMMMTTTHKVFMVVLILALIGTAGYAFGWWSKVAKMIKK